MALVVTSLGKDPERERIALEGPAAAADQRPDRGRGIRGPVLPGAVTGTDPDGIRRPATQVRSGPTHDAGSAELEPPTGNYESGFETTARCSMRSWPESWKTEAAYHISNIRAIIYA